MKGFVDDIEGITSSNKDYRRILYTGKHVQLVVMSIRKNDEIGEEVHSDRDQFFRVEEGKGEVVIDGERTKIRPGDGIVVPAGSRHNVINTGSKRLRLYTIYGPPEHKDGLVQRTKEDAETAQHFDGTTTE
ncbi:MAG TPA: cupin domain-containing protein [Gemmatimonadaceae bacterium]|jgi:mannose-6-phosphate isomerase-like protein (cupin superfamily)|nr:cupin domain-containing protein [Gemmatimonadaceae bacterium]